jgi:hypothetical protein
MLRMLSALTGASVLALFAVSAAQAQPMPSFGGFVWGQYSTGEDSGIDVDVWGGGGSAAFNIMQNFGVQGDVGFRSADAGGGVELDAWTLGGSAFFRAPMFVFGANIGNTSFEIDPFDYDVTNYGAFGEFYAGQMFTIYALGGALDGDFGFDGSYFGAGAVIYPIPLLSLTANVSTAEDDANDNSTEYGISAEYLFSPAMPVTVYGGYSRVDSDSADVDIWTFGLRFLFGGATGGTLVERDRSTAYRHTGPAQALRF